jgi:hypothetical protein
MTFQVTLYIKGADWPQKMQGKLKNFVPAWEQVVDSWARGNLEKFGASLGLEAVGAFIDKATGVFWKELQPGYMKSKRRMGYPDQIMVATGALMNSLTTRGRFFEMLEQERVVFGSPLDPDDAMKISMNWDTRQTIFLSEADMRRIESIVARYLTVPAQDIRKEVARMDIEFAEKAGQE